VLALSALIVIHHSHYYYYYYYYYLLFSHPPIDAAVSLGESNFAQSFKSTRDLSAQSQEYGNVLATNDATYTSMPGSDGEEYGTIPMPL